MLPLCQLSFLHSTDTVALCLKLGWYLKLVNSRMVSNFHDKCSLFVASVKMCSYRYDLLKGVNRRQDQAGNNVSNASQQWKLWKCHVKHYFKVSVCVCVKGQKGQEQETESQSDKPDRLRAQPDSKRKHCIHWYLCCSLPIWDRQSVITVNTWAASRLYTPAPGALHLGQEALRCFPPRSRAAWSRQIITRRPGGTWGLEFCQTLLH